MAIYNPIPIAQCTYAQESGVPATYDAFLYQPLNEGQLKLTIVLRIKLEKIGVAPIPFIGDADNNVFMTQPWTTADWSKFLAGAQAQAEMWNNKFWITLPDTVYEWNVYPPVYAQYPDGIKNVLRPNIKCELLVDFESSKPHRTIKVANLNPTFVKGTQDPGTFRSHSLLYDSFDAVPWAFPWGNSPGMPALHYVIAHEIGHALGIPHIGVIEKTHVCTMAQLYEAFNIKPPNPNFEGGSNAFVCYGPGDPKLAENIMGGGKTWTSDCGSPWMRALMLLRQRPAEALGYKLVMTDPGIGTWVGGKR